MGEHARASSGGVITPCMRRILPFPLILVCAGARGRRKGCACGPHGCALWSARMLCAARRKRWRGEQKGASGFTHYPLTKRSATLRLRAHRLAPRPRLLRRRLRRLRPVDFGDDGVAHLLQLLQLLIVLFLVRRLVLVKPVEGLLHCVLNRLLVIIVELPTELLVVVD